MSDIPPRARSTLPASYFDDLYRSDPDPWRFATSSYERNKYAATLAVLRESYDSALEVGCSIGILTRMLAKHCRSLLAIDASAQPLAQARERCRDLPNVHFARMILPDEAPNGRYDLILLSEVLYYFDEVDLMRLASMTRRALNRDGDVVLVHWTGTTNYPLGGDAAAELFIKGLAPAASVIEQQRTEKYRLDLLRQSS